MANYCRYHNIPELSSNRLVRRAVFLQQLSQLLQAVSISWQLAQIRSRCVQSSSTKRWVTHSNWKPRRPVHGAGDEGPTAAAASPSVGQSLAGRRSPSVTSWTRPSTTCSQATATLSATRRARFNVYLTHSAKLLRSSWTFVETVKVRSAVSSYTEGTLSVICSMRCGRARPSDVFVFDALS